MIIASLAFAIFTTDVSGVKNDPKMVKSVAAAAERAGVPYRVKANSTGGGGSDAGPFSQAGLKATSVSSFEMPGQMLAFYHQKWDGPGVLTIEPLLNVLRLTFEWVCAGSITQKCGGKLVGVDQTLKSSIATP